MSIWWRTSLVIAMVGLLVPLARAEEKVDFNRDIRPILSDNCFACHGPDKAKRKADLRLDTKEGLFSELDGNLPIAAGKPDKSEVFLRLVSEDEDERMPPKKANKTLTKQQTELIRKWIEQGAEFKGHWAYVKLEPPAAKPDATARTAVDALLAAKLKQNALAPAGEADKVTLVRRLYFDLLGLPPTPEEVKAFVEDRSAGAYDALVDRLLASPHYGERMAQHWLDWVRFGDSIGIHSDNPMNIWPYRDYVINAFNANKPFDQFTIEQIAGDLLPDPTLEQRIASGYNRLLITTEEGGAQPKEYTAKYGADRVRNVSAVWLGQTMGCAECHDHKFDPITAKDFYAMKAFFADVEEAAVGKREPGMPVPSPAQAAQLKQIDDEMTALKAKLNADSPELAAAQAQWEAEQVGGADEWQTLQPHEAKVIGESKLKQEEGGILRSIYKLAANETFVITVKTDLKDVSGFRLEALDDDDFPARGPGGSPNGNFVLTEFKVAAVGKDGKPTPVKLRNARADYSQNGFNVSGLIDGKDDTGWAILPQVGKPHMAMFETEKAVGDGGEATLVFTLEFKSRFPQHQIGKLRLSATTTPNPASRWLPPNLQKIIATAPEQRDGRQKKDLAAFYRSVAPMLQPLRDELAAAQKRKDELEKSLPTTLVTTAMAKPRTVRILPRGNWLDDSGPEVEPAIPEFLGQLDVNGRRANRMDLAKWIVSRENPLTPRVIVNRLWKLYFGHGISKSQEDFGAQGEWPTNPDLLDHLAVEFVESGWDVKHMVRLIVTSDAYRRTSKPTKQQKEKDPENRLYAHQSRFRHDAEVVRDNVLAVTGLLVNRIGGESVKPYQPAGYWDYLNFPKRTWEHDKGERLYRRGLYVWWQRTFLHPSLLAFDAPSREECTAERTRSNIPQQALVLLNDPSYVEAARVFAEKIVRHGGGDARQRLAFAFRQALSREPRENEVAVLVQLLEKHRAQYADDRKAAEALIRVGEWPVAKDLDAAELAAWTSAARAILNTHEMVTRN